MTSQLVTINFVNNSIKSTKLYLFCIAWCNWTRQKRRRILWNVLFSWVFVYTESARATKYVTSSFAVSAASQPRVHRANRNVRKMPVFRAILFNLFSRAEEVNRYKYLVVITSSQKKFTRLHAIVNLAEFFSQPSNSFHNFTMTYYIFNYVLLAKVLCIYPCMGRSIIDKVRFSTCVSVRG